MREAQAVEERDRSTDWESWCGGWGKTDRFDAIGWAVLLLWAAAILVAESMGLVDRLVWWDGWAVFFSGAGLIVLGEVAARALSPARRHSEAPGVIFGFILLGIGLDGLAGGWLFWPLVLTAIAGSILVRTFSRR